MVSLLVSLLKVGWLKFVLFGVVAGIFSAVFGVGGGVLLVPFLVALGKSSHEATATSLVVIIPTALVGVLRELPEKRVDWVIALSLAVGAIIGPLLGIPLKGILSDLQLRRAFSVLLILVAINMMELQIFGFSLTFGNLFSKLTRR